MKESRWFSGFITGVCVILAWGGISSAKNWRDDYLKLKSEMTNNTEASEEN